MRCSSSRQAREAVAPNPSAGQTRTLCYYQPSCPCAASPAPSSCIVASQPAPAACYPPALQRPECAWRDPDEPVFYPTKQQQDEGVALQVGLIDAATRAAVLGNQDAAGVLANIQYNLRVDMVVGAECWA